MSANGVRSGIVAFGGTVGTGAVLPVGVTMPPLSIGPPLSVSPVKPEAPEVKSWVPSRTGTFVCASVPPYVTWKPVLLNVPPAKPATVAVAPAGRIGSSAA